MADRVELALEALQRVRSGSKQWSLSASQRAEMDPQLRHLEHALAQGAPPADAYARLLGTPADLQRQLDQRAPSSGASAPAAAPALAPPAPVPPATSQI